MGQDFRLAAPRAKKALALRGKLGEILFDGSAKELVRLLAVPVRPRNLSPVPETAPRVNSRSDCCATQLAPGSSVRNETVPAKRKADGEELVDELRHRKHAKTGGRVLDNEVNNDHSIGLSKLPVEAHRMIFTQFEFIEDVICLGLTSRHFWEIGQEYIHEYYTSFLGQWAGEKIVCVGEDVKPGDFPPGLFSVEEEGQLRQESIAIPYDDDYPEEGAWVEPFTLYHFTHSSVADIEEDVDLCWESRRIYSHCRDRGNHRDRTFQLVRDELVVTESNYFPEDQAWILRNLTTKEFVRSEAISLKPEFIHGPIIGGLGFGEVVMSRICWSTSSSVSMSDTSNISRGVWAGHRFDITTLARHVDEIKGTEWRDVSEEVASEIAGIWEGEYGPDWREIVCKSA